MSDCPGACFVFVAGKTNVARTRANALPLAVAGYTTSALWRAAKGQRNWPLVRGEPLAGPRQTSLPRLRSKPECHVWSVLSKDSACTAIGEPHPSYRLPFNACAARMEEQGGRAISAAETLPRLAAELMSQASAEEQRS
jgi:hypothetical protein